MKTKLLELKHLLNKKDSLNRGTLVCYENLPIKPHLKKCFVLHKRVTVTPPPPKKKKKSVASGVYTTSPQITLENTNHRHLPLTGTDH